MELKRICSKANIIFLIVALLLLAVYYMYLQQGYVSFSYFDEYSDEHEVSVTRKEFYQSYSDYFEDLNSTGSVTYNAEKITSDYGTLSSMYWAYRRYVAFPEDYSESFLEYFSERFPDEWGYKENNDEFFRLLEENDRFAEQKDWYISYMVYQEIYKDIDAKNEWSDDIKTVLSNAEKLINRSSSILKEGGFIIKNAEKTVKDFKKLLEIKAVQCNTSAVQSVQELTFLPYCIFGICLLFPVAFLEERKNGLWNIVSQSTGGRGKLALRRCCICIVGSVIISVITHISLYTEAFLVYKGADCLAAPVQMLKGYEHCIFSLTIAQMLVLQSLYIGLVSAFVVLLAWFFLCLTRVPLFGYIITVVLIAGSYMIYANVSQQSAFAALKYINLAAMFDAAYLLSHYVNVPFFGTVIFLPRLVMFCLLVGMTAFVSANVYLSLKAKPETGIRHSFKWVLLLQEKKEIVVENLGFFGQELYQQLWMKKSIVVIAICFILAFNTQIETGIEDNRENTIKDEVFEKYAGELPDKNTTLEDNIYTYVEQLGTKLEEREREYQEAVDKYLNGEITQAEVFYYNSLHENMETEISVYGEMFSQLEYLNETEEKRNMSLWLVDERGFEMWFSKKHAEREQSVAVILLLGTILIVSLLYDTENRSGVGKMINAASGRRKYKLCKSMVLATEIILLCALVYGVDISNLCRTFRLSGFAAPVQSLRWFADFPFKISIAAFIGMVFVIKSFMFLIIALLCLEAVKKKKMLQAALILVILLLPHLLTLIGWEGFTHIDIIKLFSFTENHLAG